MIAIAVIAIAGTAFLFASAPAGMGGMAIREVPLWFYAVAALGAIGGLVWMIRIYRADPEPDQRAWRYRR